MSYVVFNILLQRNTAQIVQMWCKTLVLRLDSARYGGGMELI